MSTDSKVLYSDENTFNSWYSALSVLMAGSSIVGGIGHQTFANDDWKPGVGLKRPLVNLQARLFKPGYVKLGRHIPKTKIKDIVSEQMADSGATICVGGRKMMKSFGLTVHDLLPTKLCVKSADGSPLSILGLLVVEFWCPDNRKSTVQIVYIC